MTPHVRNIEDLLRAPDLLDDPERYGAMLSDSIAAIACLSKGFQTPPEGVQVVLAETMNIALSVFRHCLRLKQFARIVRVCGSV
jgi:hypothetical protein